MEERCVTVEKNVIISKSCRWIMAIPVPNEVEEMICTPTALNSKNSL
jgi:hypothetical protein